MVLRLNYLEGGEEGEKGRHGGLNFLTWSHNRIPCSRFYITVAIQINNQDLYIVFLSLEKSFIQIFIFLVLSTFKIFKLYINNLFI